MIDVWSRNSPVDGVRLVVVAIRSHPAEVRLIGRRIGPGELGEGGPQSCDLVREVQVRRQQLHIIKALTSKNAGQGLDVCLCDFESPPTMPGGDHVPRAGPGKRLVTLC